MADFPSGLVQPEGSFRFSEDALLLAEFIFAQRKEPALFADLGTGCGVVGLALLRRWPRARCLGVEREDVLAEAARENARNMGLGHRFQCLDTAVEALEPEWRGRAGLVVANPPWRRPEAGRHSPSPLRQRALFAEPGTLERFLDAAVFLLAPRGHLAMVCGVGRLGEALEGASRRGLCPEALQFVHSGVSRNAAVFLLKARKDCNAELKVLPPATKVDNAGRWGNADPILNGDQQCI